MASSGTVHKIIASIVLLLLSSRRCRGFTSARHERRSPSRRPSPEPPASPRAASESDADDRSNSKAKWILLVEDEDALRSAIGKFLAKEGGYNVTGVSDARSAVLVCRGMVRPPTPGGRRFRFDSNFNATQSAGDGPDCLVVDIRLGEDDEEMNGLELLKLIRSDPALEGLPVVLLTARGKVEDRILGYEVGADAYLPKPFDPEELLSIIDGLTTETIPVGGETRARADPNGNANNNLMYETLKRELSEIKSLMQELGFPERETSESGILEEQASLNSIRGDISEIKDNIKQMGAAGIRPPRPTVSVNQFSSSSVLTPEEVEIITFVAKGMTSKDIAEELQCSISKINKRLSAMCKKADVSKRTDLVAWYEGGSLQGEPAQTNLLEVEAADEMAPEDIAPLSLTAEETTVLNFLEKGMTTKEIIANTQLTKRKIASILKDLFNIANATNRTDLVRWWKTNRKEIINGKVKDA